MLICLYLLTVGVYYIGKMSKLFEADDITLPSAELTAVTRTMYAQALAEMDERHGPDGPSPKRYHTARHIQRVVGNAFRISNEIAFSERQTACLLVAASWHDIIFEIGNKGKNERQSAEYATERMRQTGIFGGREYDRVTGLIMATVTDVGEFSLTQHPRTWLEKALCDADLADLGSETDVYWESAQLEYEERLGTQFADKSRAHMLARQAGILRSYQPHLPASEVLFPHRQENIAFIDQQQRDAA